MAWEKLESFLFSEKWGKYRHVLQKEKYIFFPVKDITENDYILSANTYSPYNGEEEINHRDPKEILEEIETEKKKLELTLGEVKKLL